MTLHHLKGSIKCGRIFVPSSGIGISQVAKKISVAPTINSTKKSNSKKLVIDHHSLDLTQLKRAFIVRLGSII